MLEVHVVFRGEQKDFSFEQLFPAERYAALGIQEGTLVAPNSVTDQQICMALAQVFDVGLQEFSDHYIDKSSNGNITVRQNTPFGSRNKL